MTTKCTLVAIMDLLDRLNDLVADAGRNGMKDTWTNLNDASIGLYEAKRSVRREIVSSLPPPPRLVRGAIQQGETM